MDIIGPILLAAAIIIVAKAMLAKRLDPGVSLAKAMAIELGSFILWTLQSPCFLTIVFPRGNDDPAAGTEHVVKSFAVQLAGSRAEVPHLFLALTLAAALYGGIFDVILCKAIFEDASRRTRLKWVAYGIAISVAAGIVATVVISATA